MFVYICCLIPPNTDAFIRTLKEQMEIKTRVRNSILTLKVSFGRAKAGYHFKNRDEFEDYVNDDEFEGGGALVFSQEDNTSSPFVRTMGAAKREASWTDPKKIMEFISLIYKDENSKLYHGFLREHMQSFFRIIKANLTVNKDASLFIPILNDL